MWGGVTHSKITACISLASHHFRYYAAPFKSIYLQDLSKAHLYTMKLSTFCSSYCCFGGDGGVRGSRKEAETSGGGPVPPPPGPSPARHVSTDGPGCAEERASDVMPASSAGQAGGSRIRARGSDGERNSTLKRARGKNPTIGGKRAIGRKPGSGEEQGGSRNPGSGKNRVGSRKAGSGEEPSSSDKEPSSSDEEPNSGDEEPNSGDEEPSSGDEEPCSDDEEPSRSDEEPNSGDEEPCSGDEEPSSGGERGGESRSAGGLGNGGSKKPANSEELVDRREQDNGGEPASGAQPARGGEPASGAQPARGREPASGAQPARGGKPVSGRELLAIAGQPEFSNVITTFAEIWQSLLDEPTYEATRPWLHVTDPKLITQETELGLTAVPDMWAAQLVKAHPHFGFQDLKESLVAKLVKSFVQPLINSSPKGLVLRMAASVNQEGVSGFVQSHKVLELYSQLHCLQHAAEAAEQLHALISAQLSSDVARNAGAEAVQQWTQPLLNTDFWSAVFFAMPKWDQIVPRQGSLVDGQLVNYFARALVTLPDTMCTDPSPQGPWVPAIWRQYTLAAAPLMENLRDSLASLAMLVPHHKAGYKAGLTALLQSTPKDTILAMHTCGFLGSDIILEQIRQLRLLNAVSHSDLVVQTKDVASTNFVLRFASSDPIPSTGATKSDLKAAINAAGKNAAAKRYLHVSKEQKPTSKGLRPNGGQPGRRRGHDKQPPEGSGLQLAPKKEVAKASANTIAKQQEIKKRLGGLLMPASSSPNTLQQAQPPTSPSAIDIQNPGSKARVEMMSSPSLTYAVPFSSGGASGHSSTPGGSGTVQARTSLHVPTAKTTGRTAIMLENVPAQEPAAMKRGESRISAFFVHAIFSARRCMVHFVLVGIRS